VLDSAGRRAAFAIPRAAGEHDLLRRPLDRLFARLEYLAASSTLDDGRLVLLLLAAGVLRRHERGAPVDPPRTTAPPSRRRVLVVDDASLVRQVLADLLADAGVEVVTAEDGHAALRAVEAERPDLVVSDLDMPGMNGIELLHALRTAAPDLPVIMLTARSADDVRDRAIREGARAFLVKSDFQPALLIDAVGRCLEKAA
jgi:two-component system chemotaxis sensor kinase CheA